MNTLKYYLSLTITITLFTAAFGFSVGACDTNELGTDTPEPLSSQSELGQAIYMPSFDLGGELIQEEWFDLDENPILGEEGWHRIDYIRDPRGLVIEEIGYGLHGEPQTSLERGYATLVLEYDEHGREVYASYYDALDRPVMVNEAVNGGRPESPELIDLSFHRIRTDYFDDVTFERHYLNAVLEELHYELVDLLAGTEDALGLSDPYEDMALADTDCEVDGDPDASPDWTDDRVAAPKSHNEASIATETDPTDETEECGCGDEEEDGDDLLADVGDCSEDEDEDEIDTSACGYEGFYDGEDLDEEHTNSAGGDEVFHHEDEDAYAIHGSPCGYGQVLRDGMSAPGLADDMGCDDEENCFEGLDCDEGQENCWPSAPDEEIADCGYEGCHDEPLSELHDMADRLGLAIGEALELGYPDEDHEEPRAKEAKPKPETLKSETSEDDHLQPEGWTQEEDLENDEWMAEEDLEDEAWMHDDPNEPGC